MDETTIKKIKLMKESVPQDLFTHCNRNQVEQKYGGNAPNLVDYWPPTVPKGPYESEGKLNSGSKDSYLDHHHPLEESKIVEIDQKVKEVAKIVEVSKREDELVKLPKKDEEGQEDAKQNKYKSKKIAEIIIPEVGHAEYLLKYPYLSEIDIQGPKDEIVYIAEKTKKDHQNKEFQDLVQVETYVDIKHRDIESVQSKRLKLEALIFEDYEVEGTERFLRTGKINVESEASNPGCAIFGISSSCGPSSSCLIF